MSAAAAVVTCAVMASSTMRLSGGVCTSMVARCGVSPGWVDVAAAEKFSGIVMTAAYVPSAIPSAASSAFEIVHARLLSSSSEPSTSPAVSCRPSGTTWSSMVTGSSSFTIAALSPSSRSTGL
jgi:hypothetical protein